MLLKLLHADASHKTHTINTERQVVGTNYILLEFNSSWYYLFLPYYQLITNKVCVYLVFHPPHVFDQYQYLLSYQHKITSHHFSFDNKIINNPNTILEIIIKCNLAALFGTSRIFTFQTFCQRIAVLLADVTLSIRYRYVYKMVHPTEWQTH